MDGELLGETPLEFSILHKAVRIVVGREFYDRQERGECPCEGKWRPRPESAPENGVRQAVVSGGVSGKKRKLIR